MLLLAYRWNKMWNNSKCPLAPTPYLSSVAILNVIGSYRLASQR